MDNRYSLFNMFSNYPNNFIINKNKGYNVIANQKDIIEPPAHLKDAIYLKLMIMKI